MARKRVSGACQLSLAIAGFVLLMFSMMNWFYRLMLEQMGEPVPAPAPAWIEKWGTILFVTAWVWALFTSISVLREVKASGRSIK